MINFWELLMISLIYVLVTSAGFYLFDFLRKIEF